MGHSNFLRISSRSPLLLVAVLFFFCAPTITHAAYADMVTSEGTLLYYWQMNDAVGAATSPATTGGIPLKYTNVTAGVAGQVGNAGSFDGLSSYAVSSSTLNLTPYNKVAVEALVQFNSYDGVFKNAWESSPNQGATTTGFEFNYDGGTGSGATSNVSHNGNVGYSLGLYTRPTVAVWHHVVAVYDKSKSASEVDFYIDGVLQTASSRPFDNNNTNTFGNNLFYLMTRGGTTAFGSGRVQHVAIYSDLSAARISAHAILALADTTVPVISSIATSTTPTAATITWNTDDLATSTLSYGTTAGYGSASSTTATVTAHSVTLTGLSPSTTYHYQLSSTNLVNLTSTSTDLTFTTPALNTYANTVASEPNLLYYWPMTEGAGATSSQATVGGVAITYVGATTGSSGDVGNAPSFNGSTNYAVTASNLNLNSYSKLVVEGLVYVDAYTNTSKNIWELGSSVTATTTSFLYAIEGGTSGNAAESNVAVQGNAGYNLALYTRPSAGAWHHVVTVYDKTKSTNEVDIYVDGILQTASSRPFTTDSTNTFGNAPLYLMSRGGTTFFTPGRLQHVAIYSDISSIKILNHAQVAMTASAVTITGPSTGMEGLPSDAFTVGTDRFLSALGPTTVTLTDNGGGGIFSPSSLTLTSTTSTGTSLYTPGSAGTKVISVTNSTNLINPLSFNFVVAPYATAASLSLTSPTGGPKGVASANYTVKADGGIAGTLTVTPNDSGEGGAFNPGSVDLTSALPTGTFTYTPLTAGPKAISLTNNQGIRNPNPTYYLSTSLAFGSGIILGDSTIATYAGGTQIANFLYTPKQVTDGWTVTSIAVPGHTTAQQKAVYLSTANRATYDYSITEVGLNDLVPSEPASVAIARLQDLINTINANKKLGALTIISTMTPAKQRLINLYGPVDGLVAQQKYLEMNAAIRGEGSTPITGVDYRISAHTPLLSDGNGNLASIYDTGDSLHENDAGRQIIARVWRDSLASVQLLQAATSSAPVIGTAISAIGGTATVSFTAPVYTGGATTTSYAVMSHLGSIIGTGTSAPITVSGLTMGVNYTFTVTATNAAGVSDPSSASNSVLGYPEGGSSRPSSSFGTTTIPTVATSTPLVASSTQTTSCAAGDLFSSTTGQPCAPASTSPASYLFSRNLALLMTGADVLELQKYLNTHGFILAPSGPGSPGNETDRFGRYTYAALIRFQGAHAAEILAPEGLMKGTGYFGPSTRAFVNAH